MDRGIKCNGEHDGDLRRRRGDLHNLGLGRGFAAVTAEAQETKGKIDKLYFIEANNSWVSQDMSPH